jgi:hypothetical protein
MIATGAKEAAYQRRQTQKPSASNKQNPTSTRFVKVRHTKQLQHNAQTATQTQDTRRAITSKPIITAVE